MAVETAGRLVELVADTSNVDIMIAPVFTALDPVAKVVNGSRVGLGAQNLYWEKEGAYTGEISADMLKGLVSWCIIGHSERRRDQFESDELVGQKIVQLVEAGISPMMCCGEQLDERVARGMQRVDGAEHADELAIAAALAASNITSVTSSR